MSIARKVDGRERNVPQKACFGTLHICKGRKTTWNTYPIEEIKLLWNSPQNKIFLEKNKFVLTYWKGNRKKITQILQVINLNFVFKTKTSFVVCCEGRRAVLIYSNAKTSIKTFLELWLWHPFKSRLVASHCHFKEDLFSGLTKLG